LKKLLIATTNPGKQKEFKFFLQDLKIELVFLNERDPLPEPEEKAKSLKENALIKSEFYATRTKLTTLADDTGLIVDALPSKLGVKTHRYAQETELKGYERLIKELAGLKKSKRKAKFVTVVALYYPSQNKFFTAKGVCKGRIANSPKGSYGFGYDPIFIPEGRKISFAQMTKEAKIKLSSRGKALIKIKKRLHQYES
jgi:XTP/dITP diphosphohydrolase